MCKYLTLDPENHHPVVGMLKVSTTTLRNRILVRIIVIVPAGTLMTTCQRSTDAHVATQGQEPSRNMHPETVILSKNCRISMELWQRKGNSLCVTG